MEIEAFQCGENIIVMEMLNGYLHGKYNIYDSRTLSLKKSQNYLDDERQGVFRTYHEGNLRKEEHYSCDVLQGPSIVFYANRIQRSRAFYIDGKLWGQKQIWRSDGTLWKLEKWRDGKLLEHFEFSSDGSKIKNMKKSFQEKKECDPLLGYF